MQSLAASQEKFRKVQNLFPMRHVARQWVHHQVHLQRHAMIEAEDLLAEVKLHHYVLRHH
jgi:hypothetical protein